MSDVAELTNMPIKCQFPFDNCFCEGHGFWSTAIPTPITRGPVSPKNEDGTFKGMPYHACPQCGSLPDDLIEEKK